jgi:nucleotide-binding universal stress UspA family protein
MAGMTDGVVVGYDGSPDSDLALRWAAREAHDREARLTICHASAPEYPALAIEPPLYELQKRRGEEIMGCGVQYAEPIVGFGGVGTLLACGSPARMLCERSAAADMVVVGSRGHGRLAGLLLGSVAWQLAGHGRGRIVIIRGHESPANASPGPVVAGVDVSAPSQAALEFAAEEAALRHAPLIAVCALADAPQSLGGARQMEEEFTSLVTRWEKDHPGITVLRHVTNCAPREALLDARGRGADAGRGLPRQKRNPRHDRRLGHQRAAASRALPGRHRPPVAAAGPRPPGWRALPSETCLCRRIALAAS